MIDDRVCLNLVLTKRERYILQEHSVIHQLLAESLEDDHCPMTGFEQVDRRYYVEYRIHASARPFSKIQDKHPRGEDMMTKTMKAFDRWALSIQSILLLGVVAILYRPVRKRMFFTIIVGNFTILVFTGFLIWYDRHTLPS